MSIGSVLGHKVAAEVPGKIVRNAVREVESTAAKAVTSLGQDALMLSQKASKPSVVDAMAKMGVKAIDMARNWEGAARAGYSAVDGIIGQSGSPVANTLRKTAGAMKSWEDAANVLKAGLKKSDLLEGGLGVKGNVRGMAQIGEMAIDTARNWEGAANAGYHALDDIISQSGSPVAHTLRKSAGAMKSWEDAANVLKGGLKQAQLLQGDLGAATNDQAMAWVGMMAIDTSRNWEAAANAGYHALDGIIANSGNPAARTFRQMAGQQRSWQDAASVLREALQSLS